MTIVDLVRVRLVSVGPDETAAVAIACMLEENVGAVAVCEGARLVGIFTERDVLRLAGQAARFQELRVGDVMTTHLVVAHPDDGIVAAAHLMGERQIRHLPVLEGENVVGIVGIRDVLGALTEKLWREHDDETRDTIHDLLARVARRA